MLGGLLLILVCQLAGVFVVTATGIPVPGAVVGMVLFLGVLVVRRPEEGSGAMRAADGLLRYLPLFFVPAGAGIVLYLPTLAEQWLPVTGGLLLSWLVALVVPAVVATALRPRRERGGVRP